MTFTYAIFVALFLGWLWMVTVTLFEVTSKNRRHREAARRAEFVARHDRHSIEQRQALNSVLGSTTRAQR